MTAQEAMSTTDTLTWPVWVTTILTPGIQESSVLDPIRRAAASLRKPGDQRPACWLCQAPFDPCLDRCCRFCGATKTFLKTMGEASPDAVLTTMAAYALHGARPHLALESALPDPILRTICLLHVLAQPALSALWTDVLHETMPPAPAPTDTWPWPFPYPSRENTALTALPPDRLFAILHTEEASALDAFRRARWEENGLVLVRCPRCGRRAWYYHRVRSRGTIRWKCLSSTQRMIHNIVKATRHSQAEVRRPRKATDGCGFAFYDTTDTVFSQHRNLIKMADVLPLLFYGEAYLPILALALSPKVIHRLVTCLLTIPETQQPLVARLRAHAQRWVVTKILAATASSTTTPSGSVKGVRV
jgi:hypothetical protein